MRGRGLVSRARTFVRGDDAIDLDETVDARGRICMNNRCDLCVVQSLPELTELVRLGYSWQVRHTVGHAPITALPTSANTIGYSLYNGEPHNGKCYVIDSLGSVEVTADANQSNSTAIYVAINKGPIDTFTGSLVAVFGSMSGRSYDGLARAQTDSAVADNDWFVLGCDTNLAPVAAGSAWKVNESMVNGKFIIPPRGIISIVAVKAVATAAQQMYFFRWHEVQLVLES